MIFKRAKKFLKQFESYSKDEQSLINNVVKEIIIYTETNNAPYGLRIKTLSSKLYEARITIKLRILFFKDKDLLLFAYIGNHDEISRFLKSFR